ncbi:hypothetical protein J3E64_004164 [Sphingobium sp. OAS761]|uniref:tetratricopeptide repeat protein n=1 Tax=Sphingobium sp. OAS761 TaxID=2817901 RepID=UPI0020A05F61|nr:tetratricopeptide repeat protein [Sphingobium sp. OAS761]MCP1472440.1 hypothetical protein [Sphingobium sp. OAS761]
MVDISPACIKGFKSDRDTVWGDAQHCVLLADIVEEIIESDAYPADKRLLKVRQFYAEFEPYLKAFHLAVSSDTTPNMYVSNMLSGVRNNDKGGWAVAPLLTWLCDLYPDQAETAYEKTGLAKKLQLKRRAIVADGRPEQRSSRTEQPRLDAPARSSQPTHYSNTSLWLGREAEWRKLKEFASSDPGFRWLQLAGAGGQGKSRLADRLVRDLGPEWAKGILNADALADFDWRTWQADRPYFIIVDYLIGIEALVGKMMEALASRTTDCRYAIRLLLLERQPWNRGEIEHDHAPFAENDLRAAISQPSLPSGGRADWFRSLQRASRHDLVHEDFRFEMGVIDLQNLEPKHLSAIVASVAEAGGNKTLPSDAVIEAELERLDGRGRPLYAYFLGQALADGTYDPQWSRTDLINFVLKREQDKRWKHVFKEDFPRLGDDHPAIYLAILATMVRQIDCLEVDSEAPSISSTTRIQAQTLADGYIDGDPAGPSQCIFGLEPDILGEWFVLSALERSNSLKKIVVDAWRLKPSAMAAFCVRLAQDFASEINVGSTLIAILEQEPPDHTARKEYCAVASYIIGSLSAALLGTPRSVLASIEEGAKSGDVGAMVTLGTCLFAGAGGVKNYKAAFEWFARAAQAGDGTAIKNLGACYHTGRGVEPDISKAVGLYRKRENLPTFS